MRPFLFPMTALVVLAATMITGWLIGTWRNTPEDADPPLHSSSNGERGLAVYQVYCASCHGAEGHGDGPSAGSLRPPPRDFAARPWRFEPTESAIRQVIIEGIPNTSMPSFRSLPTGDLQAVMAHVLLLSRSGSQDERGPSPDERLLVAAGFTSLLGTTPPRLTLSTSAGQLIQLKDHAGRLILLHFWGTGCIHCIKEIPALTALEREYPDRIVVLHVCTDEDDGSVAQRVLDRTAPGTTALVETAGLGLARFEVQTLPTVWMVAPDGTTIGRSTGVKDWTAPAMLRVLERWLPAAKP